MSSQVERTLVLIKPDGLQRALVGKIIQRFEQRGLKIVALKMTKPSLSHLDEHYPKDDELINRLGESGLRGFKELGLDIEKLIGTKDKRKVGELTRQWLIEYISEAPVVAIVIEGIHAIKMVRNTVGSTLPSEAEIGTIRSDFSIDSAVAANIGGRAVKNLIHASGNKKEADSEIKHWFSEEEIYEWSRPDHTVMF
jgi:nucleoside-diphosphate kinase